MCKMIIFKLFCIFLLEKLHTKLMCESDAGKYTLNLNTLYGEVCAEPLMHTGM